MKIELQFSKHDVLATDWYWCTGSSLCVDKGF
jgi:hypothetical protein